MATTLVPVQPGTPIPLLMDQPAPPPPWYRQRPSGTSVAVGIAILLGLVSLVVSIFAYLRQPTKGEKGDVGPKGDPGLNSDDLYPAIDVTGDITLAPTDRGAILYVAHPTAATVTIKLPPVNNANIVYRIVGWSATGSGDIVLVTNATTELITSAEQPTPTNTLTMLGAQQRIASGNIHMVHSNGIQWRIVA